MTRGAGGVEDDGAELALLTKGVSEHREQALSASLQIALFDGAGDHAETEEQVVTVDEGQHGNVFRFGVIRALRAPALSVLA